MIPVKHIDPDDLVLYAMQLLPPEEMEEMSLHLQHSAEARRVLAECYADLSLFAHTAEMHDPPALARQRLMKHVAREKKVIPAHLLESAPADAYAPRAAITLLEDEPAKKSVVARGVPWVGWALAAGLLVEVVNLSGQKDGLQQTVATERNQLAQTQSAAELANALMENVKDPTAQHVSLTSTGTKPPPEGRASYVAEKGSLVFLASNLEPLKEYKTYELWIIPADGKAPIPAGTFKPDERGNASVLLPQLPKGVAAQAFGVTIEDGDGAQSPTMPIILKGAVS